jgi:hypothetical protein
MSTLPLVAAPPYTLADALGEALDGALAHGVASCVWCGAGAVATVADRWTGRVVLRCPDCGSELEGIGERRGREVHA